MVRNMPGRTGNLPFKRFEDLRLSWARLYVITSAEAIALLDSWDGGHSERSLCFADYFLEGDKGRCDACEPVWMLSSDVSIADASSG
jgi:hypothetical protein